jgi:hypothetical protein
MRSKPAPRSLTAKMLTHPSEGGSYVRNADGSLTHVQKPTVMDPFYAAVHRALHPDRRVRKDARRELARFLLRGYPQGVIERRLLAAVLLGRGKPPRKRGPKPDYEILLRNRQMLQAFHNRPRGEKAKISKVAELFDTNEDVVAKAVYGKVRKNLYR